MNRITKIWILIATFLFVVGCVAFGGVMSVLNWDFSKLSTIKYETSTHNIPGNFNEISLITNTADIDFQPSDDGQCKIICYEEENLKHRVSVQNNKLSIHINDERKWFDYIGINFKSPKITVYMPSGEYSGLSVKSSTGDVYIPNNFSFNTIFIKASTGHITNNASATETMQIQTTTGSIKTENVLAGKIELSVTTGNINARSINCNGEFKINVDTGDTKIFDAKCNTLISTGDTGDITLENVISEANLSIERSTGDVDFKQCDAAELHIKTTTGDVEGSLCSEKIFIVNTSTGRINVPDTTIGGKCEVYTSTGDIEFIIKK